MTEDGPDDGRRDFFISYTSDDRAWAEWIAWQLEESGQTVELQAWHFRPGEHFIARMNEALARADRVQAVLSPRYLQSSYAAEEWMAALVYGADGRNRLLPVRVEECELPPLLVARIYIELVGTSRQIARIRLIDGVSQGRHRPDREPDFPGVEDSTYASINEEPPFPGKEDSLASIEQDLKALDALRSFLHESVLIEVQKKILIRRFPDLR
jgi:hypothetical protein